MDQSTVEAKMTVICQGKVCTGNSASRQLGSRARHCSESSLLIRLKTQLSAASSCRRRTTGVPFGRDGISEGEAKRPQLHRRAALTALPCPTVSQGQAACRQRAAASREETARHGDGESNPASLQSKNTVLVLSRVSQLWQPGRSLCSSYSWVSECSLK